MTLDWLPRAAPLPIEGVAADGDAGRLLARELLRRGLCAEFQGLTAGDLLVLMGRDPPWVDGAIFLGQEPDARGLFLPAWRRPALHPMLLRRALQQQLQLDGPVLLLPRRRLAIPLAACRPVAPSRLEAWL